MPKYNVNFSDSAYATLNELAALLGQSMAEVIRDALTTYWWLVQEKAKGNAILVQSKGRRSEVVFPSFARIAEAQTPPAAARSSRRRLSPLADHDAGTVNDKQSESSANDLQRSGCQ